MFSKEKDENHSKGKNGDDDSDGGWSDDEKQQPVQQSNSAAALKDKGASLAAGEKLPSGVIIKKSVCTYLCTLLCVRS